MQRLLGFDFAEDAGALAISDQFMFGHCLMVAPVLEDVLARDVYLPATAGGGWYHFWEGTEVVSGMHRNTSAPLLRVPLFARRASILVVGPPLQFTSEKPADPLEIRVYDGADATFTLYEDDGVSPPAEGGAATIDFDWDEGTSTLSISGYGGRGFPARLARRTFHLVRVRSGHGVGYAQTAAPDQVVTYTGDAVSVRLPKVQTAHGAVPTIPRACVAPHDAYPFCNTSLSVDKRVDDIISRLTLDEKPTLLIARESPKGNVSRLGIPEYDWGANCIHGVQSRCSADGRCPTSYPNPNALGATFNHTVWKQMGAVMGVELRALYVQGVGENHASNLPHLGLDCWCTEAAAWTPPLTVAHVCGSDSRSGQRQTLGSYATPGGAVTLRRPVRTRLCVAPLVLL